MSCVLYKDGEILLCDPRDMAREIAAGWSVTDPNREISDPINEEYLDEQEDPNEETIEETIEEPAEETIEASEEQEERKKILGIL